MTRKVFSRRLSTLRKLHQLHTQGRKRRAEIRIPILAEWFHISRRTMERDLAWLRDQGYLLWVHRTRPRGGFLDVFMVTPAGSVALIDALPGMDKADQEAGSGADSEGGSFCTTAQQKERQAQGPLSITDFEEELKARARLHEYSRYLPDDQRGFLRLAMRRYGAAKTRVALDVATERATHGGVRGVVQFALWMLRQAHQAAA